MRHGVPPRYGRAVASRISALAAAVLAVALTGCAPGADDRDTLAIVVPALDGRFAQVADVIRAAAEDSGYRVEVVGTDGDIPAQVMTVSDLLAQPVDALAIWPIDRTSLTPVLDAAPAGTRIVSVGSLVRDTARIDAFVGFDPAAAGALQATALLQGVGILDEAGSPAAEQPGDPVRIELFAGSPEGARTEPAFAGAMSVLEPYLASGRVVVGSGQDALAEVTTLRGDESAAADRMAALLHQFYPDAPPDAVLAPEDGIARGVAAALIGVGAAPGEAFPVVTGRGAQLRSIAALMDGRQWMTVLEDPRVLAAQVVRLLDGPAPPELSVDNGAAPIPAVLVAGVPVRAGDIDELVIGGGYWSRERVEQALAEYGLG